LPTNVVAFVGFYFASIFKSEYEQNLIVIPEKAVALLDQIADAVAYQISAELSPPPEDRLITSAEATELLACKPRSVKRYIQPVRPGVYKRSEILRFIQLLSLNVAFVTPGTKNPLRLYIGLWYNLSPLKRRSALCT